VLRTKGVFAQANSLCHCVLQPYSKLWGSGMTLNPYQSPKFEKDRTRRSRGPRRWGRISFRGILIAIASFALAGFIDSYVWLQADAWPLSHGLTKAIYVAAGVGILCGLATTVVGVVMWIATAFRQHLAP